MTETLFAGTELYELLESIFSSMLDLPLAPTDEGSVVHGSSFLTAGVHITGGWNGTVLFLPTEALARLAASRLLGVAESQVTAGDARDAVAELCNIIGGSIKALLPGPSHLSLPTVAEGTHYSLRVPRTHLLARLDALSCGEHLQIRLLEMNAPLGEGERMLAAN